MGVLGVSRRNALVAIGCVLTALAVGCVRGPSYITPANQKVIDRKDVEYPTNFDLKTVVINLTAPTAFAFDADGTMVVADGGSRGRVARLIGFRPEGTSFEVYPQGRKIPFLQQEFKIHGPVGGMIIDQGEIYVSHRDEAGRGMISAFRYNGSRRTVVADLPAQGDHGVTDLAIAANGRLYFGVGSATNSGVVGNDNWMWVKQNPKFCDVPWIDLKLLGYRFDVPNLRAGLFGGEDIAVTAPFQSYGTSNQIRIRRAANEKPGAAIYSVNPGGGGLRVEAHGIRNPAGLAFNEYNNLYATNTGMELRGSRPVRDDPDAFLKITGAGTWYGWPDYRANLDPIADPKYQPPPREMIIKTGYPELAFLIDHAESKLMAPDQSTLLRATFPSLAGAAKFAFAPGAGAFKDFHGNAIVALSGDRAPFATSGLKLQSISGYKVVRVDVDTRQVREFIRNTLGQPASRIGLKDGLERPIDVQFAPDGSLYILDLGEMEVRDGYERIKEGTGKILRLTPTPGA